MTLRDIGTDIRSLWQDVRGFLYAEDTGCKYLYFLHIADYQLVDMWWDKESVWPKVIWNGYYNCFEITGLWLCIFVQFDQQDYK